MSLSIASPDKTRTRIKSGYRTPVYLLCYDIREPKRLQRIQRHIAKYGLAMQYSVYLFTNKNTAFQTLDWIKKHIHESDDVRMYKVKNNENLWLYGAKTQMTSNSESPRSRLLSWFSGLLRWS